MRQQEHAPDYTLIRSGRKTLGLEMTEEGELLVRAPQNAALASVEAFVKRQRPWIDRARERQRRRQDNLPQIQEQDRDRYLALAKAVLPTMVEKYERIMGVAPTGLTITGAKTMFGSCSAKNRISFSWRLMAYPQEAVEYVVVHELAHIRHKNHGPAFYACVASVLPDYKERIKLLRGV